MSSAETWFITSRDEPSGPADICQRLPGRLARHKHFHVTAPYRSASELRISRLRAKTDAFLLAVQDPARPQCCAVCLRFMNDALFECKDAIDEFKLEKNHLFTRCMEIVDALERAPIAPVRQRLSNAQSTCAKHGTFVDDKDVFDEFVAQVFVLLNYGLLSGSRTLERYPISSKKAHWPTSLDEMFPAGVERGLDVLIYWCCALAEPFAPLVILGLYVSSATAAVLPAVFSTTRHNRLAWAMVQAMSPKLVAWPGGVPPFCPPDGLITSIARRGTPMLVERAMDIINLISTRGRTYSNTDSDLLRLVSGREVPFLVAAERAKTVLPLITARQGEILVTFIAFLRGRLTQNAQTEPAPRPTPLLVFEYASLATAPAYAFCAHTACGAQKISASGVRNLKFFVCAKCRLVRYCHRECQRADWKAGHKSVCPILERLYAQICAQDARGKCDWDSFQRAWAQSALDDADVTLLHNWVVASGRAPAISLR